jgi:hypothetical protein
MRSPAVELFERWKELYEYLEVMAAELNIEGIYVSGDHDGTPNIGAVVPVSRARVYAEAVHAHLARNARYAAFTIRVHGVNAANEGELTLTVTNEAVTEKAFET